MNRLPYPTDLTDEQWLILEPFFPTSGYGRPPKYTKRELLNTIFYQARTGCAWRLLPPDFPRWSTVYQQFEDWREDGLWDRLPDALRRQVRVAQGRSPEPTVGAIDTQSVRTGGKRGAVTGMMRVSQ